MRISVIIPALNEEASLAATLDAVARLHPLEVIVADGGSADRTVALARQSGCQVVISAPGRGVQQQAGASAATGDVLWFLHADTIPGPGALNAITACLSNTSVSGGNFTLRFDGDGESARHLTAIYPWLRALGLCYGDSGVFVRRTAYDAVGGFPSYPLFEDIELVRRLRRRGEFRTLPETITTSSRRFEHRCFPIMFAEWTILQTLYWAGVSPWRLASLYKPVRRPSAPLISPGDIPRWYPVDSDANNGPRRG